MAEVASPPPEFVVITIRKDSDHWAHYHSAHAWTQTSVEECWSSLPAYCDHEGKVWPPNAGPGPGTKGLYVRVEWTFSSENEAFDFKMRFG